MCGIAGVVRLSGRIDEDDRTAVVRMLGALEHRGPDDHDSYESPGVILGHRRLAILDLSSAGREPMANETGDVLIIYNGEIYNFRALRAELRTCGHIFVSETDAEVLVHGYEEWGMPGLLSRLRGMFAFALYDARKRASETLYLARDRFGIKPLYVTARGDTLLFASELAALVATGSVAIELADGALPSFLQLGAVPGPATAIAGIRSIESGHYVEIENGRTSEHRYWRLEPGDDVEPSEISEQLAEAVELHLVSDVPLGVFSSGGLDSATLVALASRSRSSRLTTLSVIFDDRELSEAHYARKVAETYETDHREVVVGAEDFHDAIPAIFRSMDSPTVDGVNTFFVSRAARRAGLKVVLTGLGGDEVFLGYPHFKTLDRLGPYAELLRAMPRSVRRALALVARRWSGRDKLDYLESPDARNLYLMFRGLYSPRQIRELVDPSRSLDLAAPESLTARPGESVLESAVRFELDHYLQNQLLRDTDAMSMAHSIEARVPFLDHRLVELVFRIPHASKLSKHVNKPLLVDAPPERLPREIWDRPKQGFTLPFRGWMLQHRHELRERSRCDAFLRRSAVDAVWDDFERGRLHWSRPWALVAFTSWLERMRELARGGARDPVLEASRPG